MTLSRTRLTAYAGLAGSLIAAIFVLGSTSHTHTLGLVGGLVLACVPPGAAVMCWIDSGENAAQAGITLALSLSTIALTSALMVWMHNWQPRWLLLFAAASAVSCCFRVTTGEL